MNHAVRDIKRAQKERLLLKELSHLILQISQDDARIESLQPQRVRLSEDKSTCFVYFFCPEGKEAFQTKLEVLKLYKPSLRTALAKTLSSRRVPDLVFQFDELFSKQARIHSLLDSLKEEGDL